MEIMNRLSKKERNLLFIFCTLLILFGSYRFGYVTLTSKADILATENKELTNTLLELQQKQINKEKYIAQAEQMNLESETMLNQFPANMTQEKSTMFVTYLEDYASMKVNLITFNDISIFYSPNETIGEDTRVEETTKDLNQVNSDNNNQKANTTDSTINNYTGYKTTIALNYQTNYVGLKKCIEFINKYQDKMVISEITSAFDNSTGNLTGTITINMYALDGTNKEYEDVNIPEVGTGTDNIFGSFELPVKK